jgi:hypothetical protein
MAFRRSTVRSRSAPPIFAFCRDFRHFSFKFEPTVLSIVCSVAFGMLATASSAADSHPNDRHDPRAIRIRGTAELFVYSEKGYAPTVPISSQRPNAAGEAVRIATELRATRVPRLLLFEDAILLLGDSKGGDDAKYNMRPMSTLARYGIGVEVRKDIQIRLTHGEGYDTSKARTNGDIWNSISMRFQRADDYVEAHFFSPHNEYDPFPSASVPFAQRAVARYGVQFAKKLSFRTMRAAFVFAEPLLLFGNSRPQVSYNYSAKPLAAQLVYGAGFALKPSLQLRFAQGEWLNLGDYKGPRQLWTGPSLRYAW